MKALEQYKTVEEILEEAVKEGVLCRPPKLKQEWVDRFQGEIVEFLKERQGVINVMAWRLNRHVRADNHPREYQAAIANLISRKVIREERQVTGRKGRPCIYYAMFEN